MPSELTPIRRREVATELISLLRLDDEEARLLKTRMSSDKKYVVLAHGLDKKTADRVRAAAASKKIEAVLLEAEPVRVYPHEGAGPDSTLAAHLLGFVNRDGDRPVRRRAVLPGRPRRAAADRPRPARRRRPGDPGHDRRRGRGAARRGHPADDRCGAPARARGRGPRRVGRRQGEERVGRRHGSIHRRGPGRGDLSLVRRQRLPRDRRDRPDPLHRPGRQLRLRARFGLQDADRDRRPRDRDRHDEDEDQGRRDAQARRRDRRTSTTPTTGARAG